jgi:polar amino acid transport system substrate-binding protein
MRSLKTLIYLCSYLLITSLSLIAHNAHANNNNFSKDSDNNPNKVKVYTYHDKPPYFMHSNKNNQPVGTSEAGIFLDFVNYLNTQQNNNWYELHFMPRLRLENLLNDGELDGIIIGVNPLWFKDKEQKKFLWTSAIMNDRDIFLVNDESSINFNKPEEFIGLTFVLARGSYYKGITELAKQEKIKMSVTNSAQQNLDMLSHHRADVTIMSELTANYFFNNQYPRDQFRILTTPHDIFERMILIPSSQKHLHQELSTIVKTAASDKAWQDKLEQWHVNELVTTE